MIFLIQERIKIPYYGQALNGLIVEKSKIRIVLVNRRQVGSNKGKNGSSA